MREASPSDALVDVALGAGAATLVITALVALAFLIALDVLALALAGRERRS